MIKSNEEKVPVKTGDPTYDFEVAIATANYPPSLFMSTVKQNMITGQMNREFLDYIKNVGYLINDLDGEYVHTAKPITYDFGATSPRICGCNEEDRGIV